MSSNIVPENQANSNTSAVVGKPKQVKLVLLGKSKCIFTS